LRDICLLISIYVEHSPSVILSVLCARLIDEILSRFPNLRVHQYALHRIYLTSNSQRDTLLFPPKRKCMRRNGTAPPLRQCRYSAKNRGAGPLATTGAMRNSSISLRFGTMLSIFFAPCRFVVYETDFRFVPIPGLWTARQLRPKFNVQILPIAVVGLLGFYLTWNYTEKCARAQTLPLKIRMLRWKLRSLCFK